jgi:AraC-like DNA-binding protein
MAAAPEHSTSSEHSRSSALPTNAAGVRAAVDRPDSPWRPASDLVVDRWLYERRPAVDLTSRLLRVWRGDLSRATTLLPDERIDLYWTGHRLWVSGPETRSLPFSAVPGREVIGVAFRPGRSVFETPATDLLDSRVRLDQLWSDRRVRELEARLVDRPDADGVALELEAAVRCADRDARPADAVAQQIAAELRTDPHRTVSDLARATGLSSRQVQRRCAAAFGYGPSYLRRILRVRRLLEVARRSGTRPTLAAIAFEAGYADQQHLAHETRAILDRTPKELLRVDATEEDGLGVVRLGRLR